MQVRLEDIDYKKTEIFAFLDIDIPDNLQLNKLNVATRDDVKWHNIERNAFIELCGHDMDVWYPAWRQELGLTSISLTQVDWPRKVFIRCGAL